MTQPKSSVVSILIVAALACAGRPATTTRGPYTSKHQFEVLPDGGRITLTRDPPDTGGGAQIRAHMHQIADSFRQGNFERPGFVHDGEVPGPAVMRAGRAHIRYTPDSALGGGQLRITSRDPIEVAAVHEFLAFQRRDHRAHR